jgi:ribosomal protein S17E
MSLNINRLSTAIANDILNETSSTVVNGTPLLFKDFFPENSTVLTDICTIIAKEVINELITSGIITITVANHVHSGVLTGVGISGPPLPGILAIETGNPTAIIPTGGIA